MKILLATDGSKCSMNAVSEVAGRPWPAGTVIKVLSAVELPFVPTTETWALPESYYAELEKAETAKAQAAVDQAVERLRTDMTSPQSARTSSPPAPALNSG